MTKEIDIQQLATLSESQTFDRKSIRIAPKDLAVIMVAFANADGGTIAIGIADDGKPEGIDMHIKQANELLRVPFDYCQPTIKVTSEQITFTHDNGETDHVLLMHVAQSQKMHTNQKDEVYYRVGDKSKKPTFDERLQLLYDKGEMVYESKPVFGASLKDVDLQLVKQHTYLIGYPKSPLNYLEENNQMIVKDGADYKVSSAAILLFGRHPQNFFPRAQVRFIKYEGTEALTGAQMNVMKDVIFDGTILDMVTKSIAFVSTQIREHTYLGPDARFITQAEYPEFVWKELIINAITHRDYSILGTDIQIKMYDDRITVESPGNLPSIVRLDNMRHVHFSRNPLIAKFLKAHKFVREFGEGVDRMYQESIEAGKSEPKYEQVAFMIQGTAYSLFHNEENKTDKKNLEKDLDKDLERLTGNQKKILDFVKANPYITQSELSVLVGINSKNMRNNIAC